MTGSTTEPKKRKPRMTLAMYEDVKTILDRALESGGGTVTLGNDGQAIRWRQRAYTFRKMYAETVKFSPYDQITLKKVVPGSASVVIEPVGQVAAFTPAMGVPIGPAKDDETDWMEGNIL